MTLPRITGTGNLTKDPELRFTTKGEAVAKLTVASNESRKNQQTGEWETISTIFLPITLWGKAAEEAAEHLTKGQKVTYDGQLQADNWQDKDGNNRTTHQITRATITIHLPRTTQTNPTQTAPF